MSQKNYEWRKYYSEVDGLSPYDYETQIEFERELANRRNEMIDKAWEDFEKSDAWQRFKNLF